MIFLFQSLFLSIIDYKGSDILSSLEEIIIFSFNLEILSNYSVIFQLKYK